MDQWLPRTGGGLGGGWGLMAEGCRVSFWGDENVLKVMVVMVAQLCDYTKSHLSRQSFISTKLFKKSIVLTSHHCYKD